MPTNWIILLNYYAIIIYAGIAAVIIGIILSVWSDLQLKKKMKK